jgi:hypothetical protein
MNLSRNVAALAASVLVAGLAVTTTSTPTQASPGAKAAKAKFVVTATVSDDEPVQGDTIVIKGTVAPGEKGAVVKLQKRYATAGKWKAADKDELDGKGRFKFKDETGSVRYRQYRVVMPGDATTKTGKSKKLPVTVYGWRDLTSLSAATGTGTSETSSVNINGQAYSQSIVGNGYGNAGSISYNINRGCKTIQARFGLSDNSEDTATGTIDFSSDGTQLYTNSFSLTQSAAVVRDVTGDFRITFDWTSANTAGTDLDQSGAIIAVASPRLLCNF